MELIKEYENFNKYKANGWDTEHTYKFVFKSKEQLIEVGYFIHLTNRTRVKKSYRIAY